MNRMITKFVSPKSQSVFIQRETPIALMPSKTDLND